MNNLNLKEKIAQMLLVGIPDKSCINGTLKLIENNSIGGVILYKNNYDNLEELKELICKLKKANKNNKMSLTIAIDQEGGRVNRLPCEFINSHSIYRMAKNNDEDIKTFASTSSKLLSDLGINMNFFPVLDLKTHKDKHAIGDRAISEDINKINKVSEIIVKEFKNNNVVPVIKHFPGQGSVNVDSHFLLPIVCNYNKILEKDIIPFENMIKKDIDAIMVGHILIVGKTGLYPATLSKSFITEELRNRCNYKNVVITDELGMRGVSYLYGKKSSIIKAFLAKNDIMCCKYSDNFIENIIEEIARKIDKGIIKIEDINNSVSRIEEMKNKYKFTDNVNFDNIDVNSYNNTIERLKNKIPQE